uniref:Egg-white cystatin n=1 Tax=Bubo bubo TaxID=30461 RepID=A0A8C0FSH1_BUBBB
KACPGHPQPPHRAALSRAADCFCPLVLLQIVSGVKYIMEVEIGRTTCPKPAADLQSCAFHEAPQMAKRTVCNFVVYTIPWLNQIKLLTSDCQ